MMKLSLCCFVACLTLIPSLFGQNIVVDGVSITNAGGAPGNCSAGSYKMVGTAISSGSCVSLTQTVFSSGGLWVCDPINLNESFKLYFEANFGAINSGDGLAFVLQSEGVPLVLGGQGGGMGYSYGNLGGCYPAGDCLVQPSITVEFDTWDNSGAFWDASNTGLGMMNDIPCDHASIQTNAVQLASNALVPPTCLLSGGTDVTDGQNHDVCLIWDVSNLEYSVYFDSALVVTYNGDIRSYFADPTNVFWGFTAGSGGANQNQQVCNVDLQTNVLNPFCVCLLPNAGSNTTETYCETDAAVDLFNELNGTPDVGGSWSPALTSGTGLFDPAVDPSGVYTYTVTNFCGSVSANAQVTVEPTPDPGTNGAVSFCLTDPVLDLMTVLGGSPDLGGTWSPALASGTGVFNPASDPAGIYTYTLANSCGNFSAQVDATVFPSEDPTFAYPAASICAADPNPIPNILGTGGGVFTINNGGIINSATGEVDVAATGAGTYVVTYTTGGPCSEFSVANISILPDADASILPAGPFCVEDQPYILQAVNPGGTWSGVGVDPVTGQFDPAQAAIGVNTITYSISGLCGDAQSVQINVIANPTVMTLEDTTVNIETTIILTTVGSGGNYSWTPSLGLDCNTCQNPEVTPEETTLYTVTLEENGCSTSDQVWVTVTFTPVIFVPNIFSPNGDQNNDVLYVRGQGIQEMNFIVYDRWGEKVFQSTDPAMGWDGTFRGMKMNQAVFMYYLVGTYIDGTSFTLKGNVTLMR